MKEILNLLPVLAVAIAMNIGAGIYYNVGTKKSNFSWHVLRSGVIRAAIIAGMFIGVSYCFETTDLSAIGVTPTFIITSAIALYVGKALTSLGKILGIQISAEKG